MTSSVISLKPHHTFSLPVYADDLIIATDRTTLVASWQKAKQQKKPILFLGEGSNVLFLSNFAGTVIVNRLKGIEIVEDEQDWRLHIAAGENWHHLVSYTLAHGIPGLENLALIPGCVGSAPIQNIGAYGIEFEKFCAYVDVLDLSSDKVIRLNAEQCRFSYRESIFKHEYHEGFVIIAVGLHLSKAWTPVVGYGELAKLDLDTITPHVIFDAVCAMRRNKLPDPKLIGNAGSFFKNPVVSAEQANAILVHHPQAPHYPQSDGAVKFAAGWLIEQCDLKGMEMGGAAVHSKQALVLVNQHDAVSTDVINLARHVRQQVAATFSIWLEPEVRFIGPMGEVNAVEVLS